MQRPYPDRAAAGQAVVGELGEVSGSVVVLGLARGGVPVAAPVADALGAELDVLIVRKLGRPGQPELAMGAITSVNDTIHTVRNERFLDGVDDETLDAVREREVRELRRRERAYRGDRAPVEVRDRTVVLVDDGLATGSTMRAAVEAVRRQHPARVVVAVPVGSLDTCRRLATIADQVVCVWCPRYYEAVGQAYRDFAPVSDDEVRQVLTDHI
jgi:putative phosphoribosyl transferase